MAGQHRGQTSYGPYFTRQPVRHANRNHTGDRKSAMGATLLLLPEDIDGEPSTRYTGKHRIRRSTQPA